MTFQAEGVKATINLIEEYLDHALIGFWVVCD